MKYSIVFPGQGSQSLGMMSDLNQNFSVVNEVFQEASDSISVDLWKILNEDQEGLNLTENTQPVMLAAGYATFKVLSEETNLLIEDEIVNSFRKWLPFVTIKDLKITGAQDDAIGKNTITIKIMFGINRNNQSLDSIEVIIGE